MHVLITRPEPDASKLAGQLRALGHTPVLESLLSITYEKGAPAELSGVQAVLITSANGIRALAQCTAERALPVLCVGAASADAAREEGFTDVRSADGDVHALEALAQQRCVPENGPLLHVAGTVVAGDLAGALTKAGYKVDRQVLYAAQVSDELTSEARAALESGGVDAVLLFSPRTAKTFAKLVCDAHLEGACEGLRLLCLSQAVAAELGALSGAVLQVAKTPDAAALLELLT
jgi:uroporphyrinogen-III synthase